MSVLAFLFAVVNVVLLLGLPRRWAHVPFLLGTLYFMTIGHAIKIGPVAVIGLYLMIATGWLRLAIRGEWIRGRFNALDWLLVLLGIWTVISSLFHNNFFGALNHRLGLFYTYLGSYFLLRVLVQSPEDFLRVAKTLLLLLVPVAVEMMFERMSGHDWFADLSSVSLQVETRGGKFRAQGPFRHSILAGTAGAVCLPLAILFWRRSRRLAMIGLAAAAAIIITSGSSGPIMTAVSVLWAIWLWNIRHHLRSIRWASVVIIIALALVMQDPVYYLIARIDLTGSSSGWHRAALIESAMNNLHEWWLGGTDYTRHWMPTGIAANDQHTDITNVYLMRGVIGGLPLMLLFIGVLGAGFVAVGTILRRMRKAPAENRFLAWTLGAILFGHAVTFVSVDYFDQTVVLYYLTLAALGSLLGYASRSQGPAPGARVSASKYSPERIREYSLAEEHRPTSNSQPRVS